MISRTRPLPTKSKGAVFPSDKGSALKVQRVKPGLERHILVDIDQRRPPSMLTTWALLRIVGIKPEYVRYDWTRHGWHIVLPASADLSRAQIIALQAILGSDPKREAFNLRRLRVGVYLNQLFEPEEKCSTKR